MIYSCCDEFRRNEVRSVSDLNGIDYIEVIDSDAESEEERQRLIHVQFLNNLNISNLEKFNFQIKGGERIRNIEVIKITKLTPPNDNLIIIEVNQAGDFSQYTLQLVQSQTDEILPDGFDPMLVTVDFSFKVECPSDFDCQTKTVCHHEKVPPPQINYLSKDYASFRQLMLDRMSQLMPEWDERNPADFGVAMVELLAFTADHLSYQQDAITSEAYIGTARKRVSVRRHARLVDYFMSDGSNARTWVQVQVDSTVVKLKKGIPLFTRIPSQAVTLPEDMELWKRADVVFETMSAVDLYKKHNEMSFYTWSDKRCCLPQGATRATLSGNYSELKAGDVLVFEETIGPHTGETADADPENRHAICLTTVIASKEDVPLKDPLNGEEITEIEWHVEDALPFPFCISSEAGESLSVARGNIVLADHGLTIKDEDLGTVPESSLYLASEHTDSCDKKNPEVIPPRFRPQLEHKSLTQAAPYEEGGSARMAMQWEQRSIKPQVWLTDATDNDPWEAKRDLLNSNKSHKHFVVEMESDRIPYIRFGDDLHGKRPDSGEQFKARYRVGNGISGNIGADTLVHIGFNNSSITNIRNLFPAHGGAEPETCENVRQKAPYAFRIKKRAVTEKDYEEVTQRYPGVQRAKATYRWTGSWRTVFITVDRFGGLPLTEEFENNIRQHLEFYRMAGYDLEVDEPIYVPLEIEMEICVKSEHFRSHVKQNLLKVFTNQQLADGTLGIFHPDNYSFSDTVYLSPIYAAAQAVPGVASIEITKFQKQRQPETRSLKQGKLLFDRLEIPRLDNDPNFRERGVFTIGKMMGGK